MIARAFLMLVGTLVVFGAVAQPVYKCGSKGSIVYSHEPCLGAQVVDTTPTHGLDKWTGQSRKGADVVRMEQNRTLSEAVRPITGLSAEDLDKRRRRSALAPGDQAECTRLDAALAGPQNVGSGEDAQRKLFEKRKRFRDLRC